MYKFVVVIIRLRTMRTSRTIRRRESDVVRAIE